jgi:hypothetical protein
VYLTDYTDVNGECQFDLSPLAIAGNIAVTVTKYNYRPYEATIQVGGLVFNPDNNHYYQLVAVQESGLDWYEAKDAAAVMEYLGMQGHLVTLSSLAEEQFVLNNFPQIYDEYVWLGASDDASEGDWKWISGENWNYANWAESEPNGGTYENCLDYGDYSSKWNDENCERKLYYYLVEYETELMKINEYVTFEPDPLTYKFTTDTESCQTGAVGKFTFDAKLTNISEKNLSNLFIEVDELTNKNLLLTNNGLIGDGEQFQVPKFDDYSDGYLKPGGYVDLPFCVCLQDKNPFRFFVNVLGITSNFLGTPVPGIILNSQLSLGNGGSAGVIKTGGLNPGVEAFIDRSGQTWEIILEQLIGADYIQTAQNNADVHPIEISVTVAENTILHMFIPEHDDNLPFEWMNEANFGANWKNSGASIITGWTDDAQIWSTANPLPAGTYSFREIPTNLSFYGIAATQGN